MTIPTQTALQSAQIKGAEAAHYLAATLKFSWELIFNRDPQLVIAELNADPSAIASMQLNATLAAALNPLLAGNRSSFNPSRSGFSAAASVALSCIVAIALGSAFSSSMTSCGSRFQIDSHDDLRVDAR